MKAAGSLIVLLIVNVLSQDAFPPCKWSAAQWTTFKQCASSQSNAVISNCIRQQTSATEWNTIKNNICSKQKKKEAVKNCLLKDLRIHADLIKCNDRVKAQQSPKAG